MHLEQQQFVATVRYLFPSFFEGSKVLEVGSGNINGSIRSLFTSPSLYVGLDLAPGKDVDVVCHGADYKSDVKFDLVISTECFEHDSRWPMTFANMIHLCRPEGLVVFTCASNNRHEHGTRRTTPFDSLGVTDYYKNINVVDVETCFLMNKIFSTYCFTARLNDLYFYGIKI